MRSLYVLLIEDDLDSGEAMSLLLESEGIRVDWARTGREAIELYRNGNIDPALDVILLDLMLPDMDGSLLVQYLRRIRPTPPIVIHSAAGQAEVYDQGCQLGAAAVFRKPTDWEELRGALLACRPAEVV
ncbi:MAG TPA: response regulator [Candidatus Eisenbacteria bacterium]|jgi:DNA-binding response OmpR family regulator|nr:response regulator [Candidatus Eisenbacteria bacterium]